MARNYPGFFGDGKGYIINHRQVLDAPGKWHWENGQLWLRAPTDANPNTHRVEAQVRLWGFDLSGRSHVVLRGLRIQAASVFMAEATNCVVDGCAFRHHAPWGSHRYGDQTPYNYGGPVDGTSGIHITGLSNRVVNCYVGQTWGAGVALRGTCGLVENCLIKDINWQGRQDAAPISGTGFGHRILRNTIHRAAGMGISLVQIGDTLVKRPEIRLNHVSDTGRLLVDGGSSGIYLSNHDAPSAERTLDGGIIAFNYIGQVHVARGNKGFGICLDDGTDHAVILHNIVNAGGGIRWAVFLHGNRHHQENILVVNNTLWGYVDAPDSGGVVSACWYEGRRTGIVARNNLAQHRAYRDLGVTGGSTADHNQDHVPGTEFADAAQGDFRLRRADSALRHAGVAVAGIQEDAPGGQPDLGAWAFGEAIGAWSPGSAIQRPVFDNERPERRRSIRLRDQVAEPGVQGVRVGGGDESTVHKGAAHARPQAAAEYLEHRSGLVHRAGHPQGRRAPRHVRRAR
jgi:hypothetical protein